MLNKERLEKQKLEIAMRIEELRILVKTKHDEDLENELDYLVMAFYETCKRLEGLYKEA